MDKIIAFLDGKKTYLVALTVAVLAGLQAYGIAVPEYVYAILGALGLGSVRAAVSKNS